MSIQRKLGIASVVIGVLAALFLALVSPIGAIVAIAGLFTKGADGRRRLDWICLLGLVLNVSIFLVTLPFLRMAYGF